MKKKKKKKKLEQGLLNENGKIWNSMLMKFYKYLGQFKVAYVALIHPLSLHFNDNIWFKEIHLSHPFSQHQ